MQRATSLRDAVHRSRQDQRESQNDAKPLNDAKSSLAEAGRQAIEPSKPPTASRAEIVIFDEKTIVMKSQFELKEGYLHLRKEYHHQKHTVSALQRNFETLSKLCQAEQEEKQKLIVQNTKFNSQCHEQACRLVDLQSQIDEYAKQTSVQQQQQQEIHKLQLKSERLLQQNQSLQQELSRSKEQLQLSQKEHLALGTRLQAVQAELAVSEDRLAAMEFRCDGLTKDLKQRDKELAGLQSEVVIKQQDQSDQLRLQFEKDLGKKDQLIKELKIQRTKDTTMISDLGLKYDEACKGVKEQQAKMDSLKEGFESKQKGWQRQIDEMQRSVQERGDRIQSLQTQSAQLQIQLQQSVQLGQQQQAQLSELRQQLETSLQSGLDQSDAERLVRTELERVQGLLKIQLGLVEQLRREIDALKLARDSEVERLKMQLGSQIKTLEQAEKENLRLRQQAEQENLRLREQLCLFQDEQGKQMGEHRERINKMMHQLQQKDQEALDAQQQLKMQFDKYSVFSAKQEMERQALKASLEQQYKSELAKQLQQSQTHLQESRQKDEQLKHLQQQQDLLSKQLLGQQSVQQMLESLEQQLQKEMEKQDKLQMDKTELNEMLQRCIQEKKDAQLQQKVCYDNMCEKEREKSRVMAQLKEYQERVQQMSDLIEAKNCEVQEQKSLLQMRHQEIDSLKKTLAVYKGLVDEIETKFGGMNAVAEQIRTAKLKEASVAQLLRSLDQTMSSIECSLCCIKCKELFDSPVINIPCGHVICRGCQAASETCAQCQGKVQKLLGVQVLDDLAVKHQLNRSALGSFKDDTVWKLALKNI